MFGPIGATELIIILVLALIIFGPGKLPDVGRAIGKSFREFKKATSAVDDDDVKQVSQPAEITPKVEEPSGNAQQSASDTKQA